MARVRRVPAPPPVVAPWLPPGARVAVLATTPPELQVFAGGKELRVPCSPVPEAMHLGWMTALAWAWSSHARAQCTPFDLGQGDR